MTTSVGFPVSKELCLMQLTFSCSKTVQIAAQGGDLMLKGFVVGVTGALLLAAPAAAVEPSLSWTPPRGIAGQNIIDVDCPATGPCVAVDEGGNVLTSADPAGSWSSAAISGTSLPSVSCSSSTLCVAVSSGVCAPGNVCPAVVESTLYTSTDPTGGSGAWAPTTISGAADYLGAVDCAGGLCAALDNEGRIITSTDPTGGTSAWKVADVQGSSGLFLSAIDCPTSSFCAAVGSEPHNLGGGFFVQENVVLTSTDPTGGVRAWTKAYLGPRSYLRAISCPTTSFCLAVDSWGNAWSSSDPSAGTVAWNDVFVDPNEGLTDVSCPGSFCAAVNDSGQALTSTEPAEEGGAWGITPLGNLPSLSCPASSLCLAAGETNVAVGTPRVPASSGGNSEDVAPVDPPVSPSSLFLPPTALKVKDNKVLARLTCLGLVGCSGKAKVAAHVRGKKSSIATAPFALGDGQSKTLKIPLNKRGKKLFATKKQVQAQFRVIGQFGSGEKLSLQRTVTLKRRR
jgi:hypothetical protein